LDTSAVFAEINFASPRLPAYTIANRNVKLKGTKSLANQTKIVKITRRQKAAPTNTSCKTTTKFEH